MRVILLEDVPKLGKKGDVVNVKDGYARNYLIPRKLAVTATDEEVERLKEEALKMKEKEERKKKALLELKERLIGKELVLKARAGEKGKLFGSITASEIAEAMVKSFGVSVDKKSIELDAPIKEVGEHLVRFKLGMGVDVEVKVRVEPEG